MIPFVLMAQQKRSKSYYNKWLVSLTGDGMFALFTLNIRKKDGSIFKIVTSNNGLYNHYYSSSNYFIEFPKIIEGILERPFLEESEFPLITDRKINNSLYNTISHQRIKKILKKYFFKPGDGKGSLRRVKENYLSKPELLTVLALLSENNFIVTSDIEGYAIYKLSKKKVLPLGRGVD